MRRCRKRPGIGRTPRGESYSVIKDKKHTLRGVSLSLMAGDEGFEPPNGGTRTHCLTTWRIPNGLNYFNTIISKMQKSVIPEYGMIE